jgi:hypothetical protein
MRNSLKPCFSLGCGWSKRVTVTRRSGSVSPKLLSAPELASDREIRRNASQVGALSLTDTRHGVLLPLRLILFVDLHMGGIGGCSGHG